MAITYRFFPCFLPRIFLLFAACSLLFGIQQHAHGQAPTKAPLQEAPNWPPHLAERFMIGCANYNPQLFPHCRCVYENMRAHIPFAEFEQLAQQNQIQQDNRYQTILQACANNPSIRGR